MLIKCFNKAFLIVFGFLILATSAHSLESKSKNVPFILNTKAVTSTQLENSQTVTQGQMVIGKLYADATISLNGKKLLLSPNREFVFGVGRDETGTIELSVKTVNSNIERYQFNIIPRQWKIEKIDGLPPSKVSPRSKKLLNRIRKEGALVKKARAIQSQQTDFAKPFIKPALGRISGVYGSQRILNGIKKRPHFGQDIANKIGTSVVAPAGGVVTLAEKDLFFSGGTIIIDHGFGISTTYLHLSQLNVKVGQKIVQKQKIGEIGSTGRATGPHLDWRLNWYTTRLDPGLLVKD